MLKSRIFTSTSMNGWRMNKITLFLSLTLGLLILAGCDNMAEQPKLAKPYAESPTFGRAAREILPETVPVGHLNEDEHFYEGIVDGQVADTMPFEITQEHLENGKVNYEAFCAPCHGYSGYGDGVITQEGFQALSYHTDRLRGEPVGYFYQIITYGVGNMFDYAARIEPEQRWEIVAYIRAMQLSQYAVLDELPESLQAEFGGLVER